jgi:hemerythrin
MTLVRWDDSFLLGITLLDHDHQHLFGLINDFHNAFAEKQDRKDIARLLNQLIQYAEAHFRREEVLMAKEQFPGLAEHQQAHQKLIEVVFALQAQLESRAVQVSHNTVKFLRAWLTDHILEQDKKFSRFLQDKSRLSAG